MSATRRGVTILIISALLILGGAGVFWMSPEGRQKALGHLHDPQIASAVASNEHAALGQDAKPLSTTASHPSATDHRQDAHALTDVDSDQQMPASSAPATAGGAGRDCAPACRPKRPLVGASHLVPRSESGKQADYRPDLAPQPLEIIPSAGVRVTKRIDMGFPFDPAQYSDGMMRLHNESTGLVAVSFHGDDVSHVRLNGQPVEAGRKYLLEGEAELRADRHVGVHLRSLDGSERQPAPDGPG